VGRKFARSFAVHRAQRLDGGEEPARGRSRSKLEGLDQFRAVPPELGIVLIDKRKGAEAFIAGKLRGLLHAGRKAFPRDNRFDGRERIAAMLAGVDQRRANLRVEPDLVVDGLALLREGPLIFVF
jgi:hypothetical protein